MNREYKAECKESSNRDIKKLPLRESVFIACNRIHLENKKVTYNAVKQITGGNYQNMCKYVEEWKKETLTHLSTLENEKVSDSRSMKMLKFADFTDEDLRNFLESYSLESHYEAAEIVTNKLIAMEDLILYQEINPDKLPPELLNKLIEKKAHSSSECIEYYQAYYHELVQMIINENKKKT